MDETSVPITIDDVKPLPDFRFARCDYFTVECDMPSAGWTVELAGRQVPLLVTGGLGIVFRPSPDEPQFAGPGQIEELLSAIEEDPRFAVGTADIWIPNRLLTRIPSGYRSKPRGVTFRVGYDLFIAALRFRADLLDRTRFEELAGALEHTVTFSRQEHEAFSAWRQMQVDLARRQYPKSKELELAYPPDSETPGDKEVTHE